MLALFLHVSFTLASHPLRGSHPGPNQHRPHVGEAEPMGTQYHVDLGCSDQVQLWKHVERCGTIGRGCPGTRLCQDLRRGPASSPQAHLPSQESTCHRSEPEAGDWPGLPGLLSGLSHPLFCPMFISYRKESHSEGELGKQPWPSCPPSGVKGPGLQCTPLS